MGDVDKLERALRDAEREQAQLQRKRTAEIEDARRKGYSAQAIEEMERRDAYICKGASEYLDRKRAELAAARAEQERADAERLASRIESARQEDAPRRNEARRRWIEAGFDPGQFDVAYDDEMKKRILNGDPGGTDLRHLLGRGTL